MTPRGGRSWRSRRARRPIGRAASASPTAISASSSSAPSTRRCWTTSRASNADAVSLRDRLRRPQGDRHVLHAAADRGLPGPPHARPARPRRDARSDSRSCASSIRRWAAARFWSPPAGFSPARTRRRSSAPAAATRPTSARPSASASGGRSRNAACTASTSTRWRCSSRGSRSGWPRSRPIGRSAFSIIVSRSATACSARGWRSCVSPPSARRRRGSDDTLPLFDDDAVSRRAPRGAADPVLARGDAQRHRRTGAGEGTRASPS